MRGFPQFLALGPECVELIPLGVTIIVHKHAADLPQRVGNDLDAFESRVLEGPVKSTTRLMTQAGRVTGELKRSLAIPSY